MPVYPLWLLIFVVCPLAVLCVWKLRVFIKYKMIFLLALLGAIIFAFPWDYIAIKENVWYFTQPHIFGVWFLGLPLEEWLFLVMTTCLFTQFTILLWEKFGKNI